MKNPSSLATVVPILLVLYVLSVGPVIGMGEYFGLNIFVWPDQAILWFYYPLIFVERHNDMAKEILGSYVDWWRDLAETAFP